MLIKLNEHVLEFLIDKAKLRSECYPNPVPMDCPESIEVFDELDSLLIEELVPIYAIFLLGNNGTNSKSEAIQKATEAGYTSVELMAFEPKLHDILTKGFETWQNVN